MSGETEAGHLPSDDAKTLRVHNSDGAANIIFVCEHASNHIPREFNDLGLDDGAHASHVAWDPGAQSVATALAQQLDAPLISQQISRLVYDCNRPPDASSAIPEKSEAYPIPGNAGLNDLQKQDRIARFYEPFRTSLNELIAQKSRTGALPALITIHSFTPIYDGQQRSTEIGILHDADSRLADALLISINAHIDPYLAERNVPYGPDDGVTHTLKVHALPNGLLNVMIEIRNDRIATPDQQSKVANWLGEHIISALSDLRDASPTGEISHA